MRILTEADAKARAKARAVQNGHDLRPWRRQATAHYRIHASCKNCGAAVEVISTMIDEEQAELHLQSGAIIGRFAGDAPTRVDFTLAQGRALVMRCSR